MLLLKIKKYSIVFFCLVFFGGKAQGFKSIYRPGTTNKSSATSSFVDEVATGTYVSIGSYSHLQNDSSYNKLAVCGLNALGDVIWSKHYFNSNFFPLYLQAVRRLGWKYQNSIYYVGTFYQNGGEQNGSLIKFDFNGDTIWQKTYREVGRTTALVNVFPSVGGGFLVCGFSDSTNSMPAILLKTDSEGNLLWKKKYPKTIGKNVIYGTQVRQDSASKKIVISGHCYGFSPDTIRPIVIITDSMGNQLEQRVIGTRRGFLADIVQLSDGNFLAVGGMVTDSLDIANARELTYSMHVKFNLDSTNVEFIKIFDLLSPSNYFSTVNRLPGGLGYLTTGSLDTLMQYYPPYNYNEMIRIASFDNDGNLLYRRLHSYPQFADSKKSYFDNKMLNTSTALTSDGGIVTSVEVNNYTLPSPMLNIKFDSNGCDSTLIYCMNPAYNSEISDIQIVQIFPMPANEDLYVKSNNVIWATAEIYSTDGAKHLTFTDIFERELKINVSSFVSGFYILKLTDSFGKWITRPVTIAR